MNLPSFFLCLLLAFTALVLHALPNLEPMLHRLTTDLLQHRASSPNPLDLGVLAVVVLLHCAAAWWVFVGMRRNAQ
jgi:hypothetical protein